MIKILRLEGVSIFLNFIGRFRGLIGVRVSYQFVINFSTYENASHFKSFPSATSIDLLVLLYEPDFVSTAHTSVDIAVIH